MSRVRLTFRKEQERLWSRDNVAEAIRVFSRDGWNLTHIGERDVIGFCESCSKPILAGQKFTEDADGIKVCRKCGRGMM